MRMRVNGDKETGSLGATEEVHHWVSSGHSGFMLKLFQPASRRRMYILSTQGTKSVRQPPTTYGCIKWGGWKNRETRAPVDLNRIMEHFALYFVATFSAFFLVSPFFKEFLFFLPFFMGRADLGHREGCNGKNIVIIFTARKNNHKLLGFFFR